MCSSTAWGFWFSVRSVFVEALCWRAVVDSTTLSRHRSEAPSLYFKVRAIKFYMIV